MNLEALASIAAKGIFGGGGEKPKEGEPGLVEQAAGAIGKGDSGLGSTLGSTIGGTLGSALGPVGSAVGSMIGGQLGTQAEKGASVQAGPGATIESGTTDVKQPFDFGAAAVTVAGSLQSLATKGFRQEAAASGKGKKF